MLWKGCLLQPGMASLACANFVIYGLKSALISWLAFYAPRQKLGREDLEIFGVRYLD